METKGLSLSSSALLQYRRLSWITILIGGSVLVVGIWLAWGYLPPFGGWRLAKPTTLAEWGQWGDRYGALNCLFAGLAAVVIIATLKYTDEQNAARAVETAKMMDSLTRTSDALERQAKLSEQHDYLTALIARIDGYTRQMAIFADHAPVLRKLQSEQEELLYELSDLLFRTRNAAGGKAVFQQEIVKRKKESETHDLVKQFMDKPPR